MKTRYVGVDLMNEIGRRGMMMRLCGVVSAVIVIGVLTILPLHAEEEYFPDSAFDKGCIFNKAHRVDADRKEQYSRQLKALREPALYRNTDSSKSTYRCLLMGGLRRYYDAVRVAISPDGTGSLYVKEVDTGSGRLTIDKTRVLSKKEIAAFLQCVRDAGFWELPSRVYEPPVLDAEDWVVEGAESGRYHVVMRSAAESGGVQGIGQHLMELSGIWKPERDK